MPQIRNGKFADAEVPIGMSRPLDIKRLAKIKRRLDLLAHQLVENDAIVNAVNGNQFASAPIMQPIFLLH